LRPRYPRQPAPPHGGPYGPCPPGHGRHPDQPGGLPSAIRPARGFLCAALRESFSASSIPRPPCLLHPPIVADLSALGTSWPTRVTGRTVSDHRVRGALSRAPLVPSTPAVSPIWDPSPPSRLFFTLDTITLWPQQPPPSPLAGEETSAPVACPGSPSPSSTPASGEEVQEWETKRH